MRRFVLPFVCLAALPAAAQEVYFAPFDDPQAAALRVLDECQSSLDVAQYNIRNPEYVEKLRELRARNVKIRVVVDKKNADQPYNTLDDEIEAEGFELVRYLNTAKPLAIMHLKAVVIDRKTVMTGSFNWNETAQLVNDENMLVIRDENIARGYAREIDELFGAPEEKGPYASADGKIEVWFSPEDNPRRAIIDQIRAAKSRILVAMFTFADGAVANELHKAAERGVEVVMVVEKKQADRFHADEIVARPVTKPGARQARVIVGGNISSSHSAMHQKFAVFDGKKVMTGACNWTPTAFGGSNEDVILLDDPQLARRYTDEFAALVLRYAPEQFRGEEWGVDRSEATAHFVVHCEATQEGDEVYILGSHPRLGLADDNVTWNIDRGLKLTTSDRMWPAWVGNVRLPRGARVEWKAVVRSRDGTIKSWELEGPGNRVLEMEPGGTDGAWLVRFDTSGRIEAPRSDPGAPASSGGSSGGIIGNMND